MYQSTTNKQYNTKGSSKKQYSKNKNNMKGSGKKGEKNHINFDQYVRTPDDIFISKKDKLIYNNEETEYKHDKKLDKLREQVKDNKYENGYELDDFVVSG